MTTQDLLRIFTLIRHSVAVSGNFTSSIERHVGLYVSVLQPALDARAARGEHVTQHERLGDEAINAANATHRHNEALHAVATAIRASGGPGSVQLGDKGDGTAASKADARRRYAHLNAGHIPDIIQGNTLTEIKCLTPHLVSPALGHGSAAKGGAPSTADGHLIAFGNTLESLIKSTLGLKQRGAEGQRPFDRPSGEGFVAACDGDYADALRKKRSVVLFLTESSGAVESRGVRLFARLGKDVRRKGAVDGTVYGSAATSTRSFFVHHLSAIAAGVIDRTPTRSRLLTQHM